MLNSTDFLEAIKKASLDAVEADKPTAILFGKVSSVKPLKINVEQRMHLGASQLILTRNVTNIKTTVAVGWETQSSLDSHTDLVQGGMAEINAAHAHKIAGIKQITINNGLVVGDKVILMRVQGGQKYIVLDKVV